MQSSPPRATRRARASVHQSSRLISSRLGPQALNSLSKLLEERKKNVSSKTFLDDASIVREIRFFRDKDYRIVFGLFDQYMAVKVFCAVCCCSSITVL